MLSPPSEKGPPQHLAMKGARGSSGPSEVGPPPVKWDVRMADGRRTRMSPTAASEASVRNREARKLSLVGAQP